MFSQVSVCPQVGCVAGGMHGGEGVHEGACVVGACIVRVRVVGECMGMCGRGACIAGGHAW